MKIETWNGYEIRFVEKDGEWWAVLKDVCDALGLKTYHVKERLPEDLVSTDTLIDRNGRPHDYLVVSELGIYEAFGNSRKHKRSVDGCSRWFASCAKPQIWKASRSSGCLIKSIKTQP